VLSVNQQSDSVEVGMGVAYSRDNIAPVKAIILLLDSVSNTALRSVSAAVGSTTTYNSHIIIITIIISLVTVDKRQP